MEGAEFPTVVGYGDDRLSASAEDARATHKARPECQRPMIIHGRTQRPDALEFASIPGNDGEGAVADYKDPLSSGLQAGIETNLTAFIDIGVTENAAQRAIDRVDYRRNRPSIADEDAAASSP